MRLVLLAVLSVGLFACGDTKGPTSYSAPEIWNFVYQPQTIGTHDSFEILCTVEFKDADADATSVLWRYWTPDGTEHDRERLSVNNLYGIVEGKVSFRLITHIGVAGTYPVEIWAIDELDLESNRLRADIEAF